jgi:hypothetical protein
MDGIFETDVGHHAPRGRAKMGLSPYNAEGDRSMFSAKRPPAKRVLRRFD